jgi:hypothetical protein
MGNTCSSVHIGLPGLSRAERTSTTHDAIEAIVRAYSKLGFERAKTASPEGGKHVIVLREESDGFLSVYDSDNATLDTGELKELALAASKIFKTAAVCTSLYDSDTFEVVVFHSRNSSERRRLEHVEEVHAMVQKRTADGHTAYVGLSSADAPSGQRGCRARGAGHRNQRCVRDCTQGRPSVATIGEMGSDPISLQEHFCHGLLAADRGV